MELTKSEILSVLVYLVETDRLPKKFADEVFGEILVLISKKIDRMEETNGMLGNG